MLTMPSPAKVNLFLEVPARRQDGYHDIDSVFAEISLADTVSAEEAPKGERTLECDNPAIPVDENNLILKAADVLALACGVRHGVRFVLRKNIPAGAGLGGGSSNAAAALKLANQLWNTGLSRSELAELGARIGSDVPFFLHGGVCLCRGRGETVTPLAVPAGLPDITLALTRYHSATAEAYRTLRLPGREERKSSGAFIDALNSGDPGRIAAAAFNRFEQTVFSRFPGLDRTRRNLAAMNEYEPRLSGSGSALWFIGKGKAEDAGNPETADWGRAAGLRLVPAELPAAAVQESCQPQSEPPGILLDIALSGKIIL